MGDAPLIIYSKGLKNVRRARKFRVDPLVHIVHVDKERDRPIQILCTKYWVYRRQVNHTDEPATCLGCIAKDRG